MDGYFARKLPEMLLAHGLELQFAEIDTATGRSGGPEYKWMRTTVLEVNGQAVTARVIDAATRRVMEKVFATSGMVVTRPSVSSRLGSELTRQRPPCQPLTPLGASCMDGTGRLRVR